MDTLAFPRNASETRAEVVALPPVAQARWSLAFVGILAYVVVEYTRLPAMFPVLQVLHLGKVVVVMSALGLILSPRLPIRLPAGVRKLDIALVLFLFGVLLSAIFALSGEEAWSGLRDALLYVSIAFLIGRIVNTSWRVRVFLWLLLLLNFKLGQFVIRSYQHLRNLGVSEGNLAKGVGAGSTGFFSNSADFGVAMCVVWALTIPLLFAEVKRLERLLLLGFSLTFLAAILLCGSRGALVGAAAIVVVALVRTPRKATGVFAGVIFLAGTLFLLPEANRARLRSAVEWESDANALSRLTFWKAGLRMFARHPLTGVGIRNFPPTFANTYAGDNVSTREWACHSMYIQAISELGLAGTLPLLGLGFLFLRLNALTRRQVLSQAPKGRGSFEYCMAAGLDLAFVGYLASGAFLSVLFYPHLWVLLGWSVGLNVACASAESQAGGNSLSSVKAN